MPDKNGGRHGRAKGISLFMKRVLNLQGRIVRAAAAVAAAAVLPAAAAAQETAPAPAEPRGMSEAAAAVVNDEIISTYDLAQRMRLLIATSGVEPTQQNIAQFQREALVSLVDERLQIQELREVEQEQKFDLVASDEEVDEEMRELAQANNMTLEQFEGMMRSQGIYESLREQTRVQTSWSRWIRGRYGSRLRVGDDQVTATIERLQASANKPQYQVSEVFIDAARVGGMDVAMNGANQLVSQLQQGAPFQAVARQFSASATAASGGDAGWIGAGEMPTEVEQALEQMRPGQLSRPIPVRDGVYIIYLRDKRAGAGATMVHLKQAAVSLPAGADDAQLAAARARLEQVRPRFDGCDGLEAAAEGVPGVIAGDLGEAEIADLAPAFRDAAQSLDAGQLSQPIRTQAGLHLVAVCQKRASGAPQISREQVENRLWSQQLALIARRYMRDLRNSATIETR